jgi:hypothetical protein
MTNVVYKYPAVWCRQASRASSPPTAAAGSFRLKCAQMRLFLPPQVSD